MFFDGGEFGGLPALKKTFDPFSWMRFNCFEATEPLRGDTTFYHSVPRISWYSFNRPPKDERLS